jgi:hypothetical protein
MVAGAIGGAVSETVAEWTKPHLGHQWAGNAGILSGPLAALLLDQNVDVASATASNAIVNNYNKIYQEAQNKSVEEFVKNRIKNDFPEGAPSPEVQQQREEKYTKLYYQYRMFHLSGELIHPGQDGFSQRANMTLEELKSDWLSTMDSSGQLSPRSHHKIEKIATNEYHFLQSKQAGFAMAAIGGVGSLCRVGRAPVAPRGPTPANLNVVYDSQKLLLTPQGIPNAGGYIRSFVTEKNEVYYRVYSDNPVGRFITKVPPKNSTLAREGLALPPSNEATYIQEVFVPAGTRLQRSRALPAFGNRGGTEQFEIFKEDMSQLIFNPGKKID